MTREHTAQRTYARAAGEGNDPKRAKEKRPQNFRSTAASWYPDPIKYLTIIMYPKETKYKKIKGFQKGN